MDHVTVQLLKDRFDLADGEAEHILGSFVDAVERRLEEFGICHVAGVGSFVRAPGDSRISFEPAEALIRAVNVRFADLPVYEIGPGSTPRPESESPGAEPATESRSIPSRSPSPPVAPSRAPEQPTERHPPKTDTPIPASSATAAPEADEPDQKLPATNGPSNESSPTKPRDSGRRSVAGSRRPRTRRRKSSGGVKPVWFVLPLLVALVAVAVWIMQRPASEPAAPLAEETAPAAPESGANADADVDAGEPPPPDGLDDPAEVQTEPSADAGISADAEADAATAADDEAREAPLDRTVDGYTMIVGSSPDRTSADEQIRRFTELDLPYGVLDYSEDGSPMYRLAVGLFDSVEQADSARQAMADALPSGTWVWRIR